MDIVNPRRGDLARSMSAPTTGPATAAAAVRDATMYEPVLALPSTAIEHTSRAGPEDSVAERASVADAR
jgi:hypothetical protein